MSDWSEAQIIWDEDPPNTGIVAAVRANIRKELEGLPKPGDLIFHHVFLSKDRSGPSVHLTGDTKLNCFRAIYSEETKWYSWDEYEERLKKEAE